MNWIVWAGFFAIFIGVLALDLGVLHRESRVMSVRQALGWTLVWISVAMSFTALVYGVYEHHWFGWKGSDATAGGAEAAPDARPEVVGGAGLCVEDCRDAALDDCPQQLEHFGELGPDGSDLLGELERAALHGVAFLLEHLDLDEGAASDVGGVGVSQHLQHSVDGLLFVDGCGDAVP